MKKMLYNKKIHMVLGTVIRADGTDSDINGKLMAHIVTSMAS
jgi:hypothetical protein